MTYNVFSGTLNLTQQHQQKLKGFYDLRRLYSATLWSCRHLVRDIMCASHYVHAQDNVLYIGFGIVRAQYSVAGKVFRWDRCRMRAI